jgi:hypothetical protein
VEISWTAELSNLTRIVWDEQNTQEVVCNNSRDGRHCLSLGFACTLIYMGDIIQF